eukprot:scaffold291993_cov24-Tisochrysis_lutea.AAC.5
MCRAESSHACSVQHDGKRGGTSRSGCSTLWCGSLSLSRLAVANRSSSGATSTMRSPAMIARNPAHDATRTDHTGEERPLSRFEGDSDDMPPPAALPSPVPDALVLSMPSSSPTRTGVRCARPERSPSAWFPPGGAFVSPRYPASPASETEAGRFTTALPPPPPGSPPPPPPCALG